MIENEIASVENMRDYSPYEIETGRKMIVFHGASNDNIHRSDECLINNNFTLSLR